MRKILSEVSLFCSEHFRKNSLNETARGGPMGFEWETW